MAGQETGPLQVVVVGGGFTGALLVMNVIRATTHALAITVVDPAAELGRGLAYGTTDPAHRINVPSDRMSLFKGDPDGATRWMYATGVLPDANSLDAEGHAYVPRHAYGSFVADSLHQTIAAAGDRVTVRHRRAQVNGLLRRGADWEVTLADGEALAADLVALCFGHAVPFVPCPIDDAVRSHPKFVADPWATTARDAIAPDDAVLVVGTGLTMADVVVSLRERGHRGPITAVSRRGLLPRPHGQFRSDIDIFAGEAVPATALGLLRLLRRRIRTSDPSLGWAPLVDALRFQLPLAWGALPPREKARVMRRLLPFWEVHRFRIAPQVAEALERGRADGALTIERAGLVGLARRDGRFAATLRRPDGAEATRDADAVVLCTGPEKNLRANPLVAALLADGTARLDDVDTGLAVDPHGRVLDRDGRAWPSLLAFGPLTRGTFGEMTGAPDIAKFLEAEVPGLFARVGTRKEHA